MEDWIYKSERYFEIEHTAEEKKIWVSSVYMYGKALQWHYTFVRNRGSAELPLWIEYVEALTKWFGKAVFEDSIGMLKNLRHEGIYDNLYVYMEEFDACLRRMLEKVDLPEEFHVSLFINGLEEYRRMLWLLKPTRLLDMQSNARLVSDDVLSDQTNGGTTGPVKGFQRGLMQYSVAKPQVVRETNIRNQVTGPQMHRHNEGRGQSMGIRYPQTTGVRKKLSQEEINERRNKNLCFECNEPYSMEHKCAKKQLYSMVLEP